jgi:hypothetical protein
MLSEISQSQKTNTILVHLYELSKIAKFIDNKSRMVVTRGWRKEAKAEAVLEWM